MPCFFFLHFSIFVKENLSLKLPSVIKADFLLAISIQNQTRQVMRVKRNINQGITSWSDIKFSKLTLKNWLTDSKENYWWDLGRENVKVTSLFRYIDIYQVCWHKISLHIVLITQIPPLFRVKKCFTLLNPMKKISPSMRNGFPLLGKARCSLVIWWRTATSVQ